MSNDENVERDAEGREGSAGSGGLLEDPRKLRSDLKLIEQSIRRRWKTDDRIKDALLSKIARIALTSEKPREQVAAARCYLMAEQQNLLDDHKLRPDQVLHAHVDLTAQEAVSELTLEELRVLRQVRAKVTGEVQPDESHDGNGSHQGNGNGRKQT